MSEYGALPRRADGAWCSFVNIFSVVALLISLAFLNAFYSMLVGLEITDYKNLYQQLFFGAFLIPALMASGNYLSKRCRLRHQPEGDGNASRFRRSIDLGPLVIYLFVFLLGIAVSSYYFYQRLAKTKSIVLDSRQLYDLKKSAHHPAVTCYFETGKYDSITGVVIDDAEHRELAPHDYTKNVLHLIADAAIKPDVINVYGFSDESGLDDKNIMLSRKRAEFVESTLMGARLPGHVKINTINAGVIVASCDKVATERAACLAHNRRVDIYFDGYLSAQAQKSGHPRGY